MFYIGDCICYPMHGAGKINEIEKNEVNNKEYYVVLFTDDNLKMMVPISNAKQMGMRKVLEISEAEDILAQLADYTISEEAIEDNRNWNTRYRENMDKLRSGLPEETIEVIATLTCRDESKGLSTGEKKILKSARKIFEGELVLCGIFTSENVSDKVEEILDKLR